MPDFDEDTYDEMLEMAAKFREFADKLDNIVGEAMRGHNPNRFRADGDVDEKRVSKDIEKNGIDSAVKAIELDLVE